MPSPYPTAFDDLPDPTEFDSHDTPGLFHDVLHADTNSAIEKVQQALGLSPAETLTHVAARLEYLLAHDVNSAIGDGSTDITIALQDAIDAAPDGGAIRLPRGHFMFSTLSITKSLTIYGSGWRSTVQDAFGNAAWGVDANHGGTILESTATSGVAITFDDSDAQFSLRDLLVIGPGSGTSTGIKIGTAANFSTRNRFDNVQVSNFSLGWDVHFVLDSTFIDCRSRGNKTGFHLDDATNQNTWINTEVQHSDTDGIVLVDSTANRFIGGVLQNISGATGIKLSDAGCSMNTFDGWYMEPTTTPTRLLHQIAGVHNRYRDWWISNTGQALELEGGARTVVENITSSAASATLTIGATVFDTRLSFLKDVIIANSGEVTSRFDGDEWEILGTGGPMRIDSGTGGSFVDVRAWQMRFEDQTGALSGAAILSGTSFKGALKSGGGATGDRPSAATVTAGAMWFDTTLGHPIWSDGTDWVDATGTPV